MPKTKKIIPFAFHKDVYKPEDIEKVLQMAVNKDMLKGNNKSIYYYNVACSFDIETTSFYIDENKQVIDYKEKANRQKLIPDYNPEKRAIMYVWQFGINGYVIMGRTWKEFFDMLDKISSILELNENKRLMIFIHNLSYEFQFMCKWVKWYKTFNIDKRKPLYAITENFIEFRCSLQLSGYSLANLSNQLLKYKVEKKVGDLDYSLLRNSKTPLTEKEIGYCVNDVFVVMAYIQEKIENEKGVHMLPLTNTGYVRKYCRNKCNYTDKHKINYKYTKKLSELTISGLPEYELLKRAFCGGFTHANAYYVDDVITNVGSYDFTSSYPYVMLSEEFPMSKGVKVNLKCASDFYRYIKDYLCVFDIAFYDLEPIETHEQPLSVSKCWSKSGVVENNGRVVYADKVVTTITNIDYNTFKSFYKWKRMEIANLYVYTKKYLPTELVNCVLDLYSDKTTLKDVDGMEIEYMNSKGMLNSCYGMCVTDPLRDEYIFSSEGWETLKASSDSLAEMLDKYNNSKNRFLYYIWGVFITAYARRNLFTGVKAIGDDYIYSDTDSIKLKNHAKHKWYFKAYNEMVKSKLEKACKYHGIDFERVQPKTKEGKTKLIGIWDFEGVYKKFKTLGAKRYMIEKEKALKIEGKYYPISITVSGVNKFKCVPYLLNELGKGDIMKAFGEFKDGLHVPPEKSGKNIHTYIDDIKSGELTDYLGNTCSYLELSSVHLEPTSYDLSLAKLYADYLRGIKTEIY